MSSAKRTGIPAVASNQSQLSRRTRLAIVLATAIPLILLTIFTPPITQPQAYHHFADRREFFGIPNTLDVLSNLPFLVVGLLALRFVYHARHRAEIFATPPEVWIYTALFLGVALTGLGSAYYHLAPDDRHLVFDRLPMTLGFMSLLCATIAERIHTKAGVILLPILLAIGIGSVLYWYEGDAYGGGDLRLYVDVQFYPLLLIPLIVRLFPPRYTGGKMLLPIVGMYALAKLLEVLDIPVYHLTDDLVSGHTLKHLAAAYATYLIWVMLRRRRPTTETG